MIFNIYQEKLVERKCIHFKSINHTYIIFNVRDNFLVKTNAVIEKECYFESLKRHLVAILFPLFTVYLLSGL